MKLLKKGDIVEFNVGDYSEEYEVSEGMRGLFMNAESSSNNRIFYLLKLDKLKIAQEAYGYKSIEGDWPETQGNEDYQGLTRLVMMVLDECNKFNHKCTQE